MPLLERADSILIVVDAQAGFSGSGDESSRAAAAAREVAAWLTGVAAALGIPVVVTEEDAAQHGPTDAVITSRLPEGTPVLAKTTFNLADEATIVDAVHVVGRGTAVLVGAETEVCVAQSAIGLRDRGYRVVVVSDATFSPGAMHERGLAHVRAAGIEVRHAKGVYYEWVRTLDESRRFEIEHPDLAAPPSFAL